MTNDAESVGEFDGGLKIWRSRAGGGTTDKACRTMSSRCCCCCSCRWTETTTTAVVGEVAEDDGGRQGAINDLRTPALSSHVLRTTTVRNTSRTITNKTTSDDRGDGGGGRGVVGDRSYCVGIGNNSSSGSSSSGSSSCSSCSRWRWRGGTSPRAEWCVCFPRRGRAAGAGRSASRYFIILLRVGRRVRARVRYGSWSSRPCFRRTDRNNNITEITYYYDGIVVPVDLGPSTIRPAAALYTFCVRSSWWRIPTFCRADARPPRPPSTKKTTILDARTLLTRFSCFSVVIFSQRVTLSSLRQSPPPPAICFRSYRIDGPRARAQIDLYDMDIL